MNNLQNLLKSSLDCFCFLSNENFLKFFPDEIQQIFLKLDSEIKQKKISYEHSTVTKLNNFNFDTRTLFLFFRYLTNQSRLNKQIDDNYINESLELILNNSLNYLDISKLFVTTSNQFTNFYFTLKTEEEKKNYRILESSIGLNDAVNLFKSDYQLALKKVEEIQTKSNQPILIYIILFIFAFKFLKS